MLGRAKHLIFCKMQMPAKVTCLLTKAETRTGYHLVLLADVRDRTEGEKQEQLYSYGLCNGDAAATATSAQARVREDRDIKHRETERRGWGRILLHVGMETANRHCRHRGRRSADCRLPPSWRLSIPR